MEKTSQLKFHNLYHSSNIARVIQYRTLRWAGHVARMQGGRSAFKILAGNPTEKRHLGMPRHRWEDNIRMGRRWKISRTETYIY